MLEENGFGVIGVYNGDKGFLDEDQVYAWTQCQQKYVYVDVGMISILFAIKPRKT